jgi:hypothetical protein
MARNRTSALKRQLVFYAVCAGAALFLAAMARRRLQNRIMARIPFLRLGRRYRLDCAACGETSVLSDLQTYPQPFAFVPPIGRVGKCPQCGDEPVKAVEVQTGAA